MSNWTKLGQHGELENRSSRWDHREEPRKRAWTSEEGYKSPNLPFSSCVTYSNSGGLPSYTSWTSQFNCRNPQRKRELKGKNAFNERYNDKPTVSFNKWLSQRNRSTDQRTPAILSWDLRLLFQPGDSCDNVHFSPIHHTLLIASPRLYLMFGWRNSGLIQGRKEDMCWIYAWSNILFSTVAIHGRKFRMTQRYVVFTLLCWPLRLSPTSAAPLLHSIFSP